VKDENIYVQLSRFGGGLSLSLCTSNNNAKVFAVPFHCNKAITNRGLHYHLAHAGQGALLRLRAVAQRETSGNDEVHTQRMEDLGGRLLLCSYRLCS
jgi:hypothetical protein